MSTNLHLNSRAQLLDKILNPETATLNSLITLSAIVFSMLKIVVSPYKYLLQTVAVVLSYDMISLTYTTYFMVLCFRSPGW